MASFDRANMGDADRELTMADGPEPWIVPIPGTTVMAHMMENSGADSVKFTSGEVAELNSAVKAIEIKGQRLPDRDSYFPASRYLRRNS
jgi:hypothetical protein